MKLFLTCSFLACFALAAGAAETNAPAIIPIPQEMTRGQGIFLLRFDPQKVIGDAIRVKDSGSKETAEFLAARLRSGTGGSVTITPPLKVTGAGNIWLFTNKADSTL